MPNKGIMLLRRVWLWLTAGLTVVTGICLMAGCLAIYRSGDRPFSPESVAAQFDQIAWLVWLTVGCIAAGFLLELLFPAEKSHIKAIREEADTLADLQAKAGTVTDEALAQQLAKEQARCRKRDIACIAAMCAVSVRPFLFFLEPLRFTIEKLNQDILQFAIRFVISGSIILVLAAVRTYWTKAALSRQISIYKTALAEKKCDQLSPAVTAAKDTKKAVCYARIAVAAVAVVFILLGVMNEGILDVLGKAIAICTECIGLG